MKLDLKYVNCFKDRYGEVRCYYRPPGKKGVPLPGKPEDPDFLAAYLRVRAESEAPHQIAADTSDTLESLIARYYRDSRYTGLAEGTKPNRRTVLERLRKHEGDKRISTLTTKAIVDRLATLPTPAVQNNWLVALRDLCGYAKSIKAIKEDPTAGIARSKASSKPKGNEDDEDDEEGHHTWTPDELAQYAAYWPIGSMPRLVFELGFRTAQRRSDLVRMGRQHVGKDGWLKIRQKKTGVTVHFPLAKELVAAIDACERPGGTVEHQTFILNAWGKPFSHASALAFALKRWAKEAGLPDHCTIHGLRKAFCVAMAEKGKNAMQIAAVTGHTKLEILQKHYLDKVDKRKLAYAAILG